MLEYKSRIITAFDIIRVLLFAIGGRDAATVSCYFAVKLSTV